MSALPAGVLVVGQAAEPRALDPHAVTALNDFRILANLYEGLVRYRPGTLDIAPGLAERWEVSEDGLTYRFRLREGVHFHDGSPFDAGAVRFNFERLLDRSHPFHHTGPFPLAFFFEAMREVRALDPHTVALELSEPFAPLLSNLAYPTGFMVSPAALRAHGKTFGRHPSGTGPLRFVDWESQRRVMLARNPDYHGGPPALETVIFRPLTDPNARVTELLAGGVDLLVELPADLVALFRAREDFRVHEREGPHLWFLILNTAEGPFRDPRVRRAVNLAVDKQALVERVLQGTASVAAGPVPRAFGWAHDPAVQPYPHDPAEARRLIEAAGHAGAELTLLAAQGGSGMLEPIAMATAIQADLARVGLRVAIRTYEWNTYLSRVNGGLKGLADMAEMAWMTNDPDTLPYLSLRSGATPEQGGFNSGYYADPEVDRLIESARATPDRDARARLYRRLQARVHADAPWLFVASWKQNAVTGPRVSGFALEPSFLLRLAHVRAGTG